jgi:Na+-transporting NADH:ubiquinone oxidoreductase subunit NqrB
MFADPRDYQILFLVTFLGLGVATRDWSLKPELIATLIITCGLTQLIASYRCDPTKNPWLSVKSALITSLGLSLLLRADRVSTMVLAGVLAIGSKFIFTYGDKHWFNPANFGIVLTLLIAPDAWE